MSKDNANDYNADQLMAYAQKIVGIFRSASGIATILIFLVVGYNWLADLSDPLK